MTRYLMNCLGAALVAAGLLSAGPAEARFGKKTEKTEEVESRQPTKKARPKGSHSASAVGSRPSRTHVQRDHSPRVKVRPRYRHHRYRRPWYAWGWGYAPRQTVVVHEHHHAEQPAPEQYEEYESPSAVKRFELGGTAQPLLNGSVLGLNLLVDWTRVGMDLRFDNLSLVAEDGTGGRDHIRMFDATATFGLLTGDRGRLRAHLGAYTAFAPDIAMIGPGGGFSASLDLLGPITTEASAQLVLFPFTKIDTRAAMGLRLGPVEGRLGWRFMILDDQGRVDGVRNVDLMTGPYIGALIRL